MSAHYPRIRLHAGFETPMVREGLSLDFFLPLPHTENAKAVLTALETYVSAIGEATLGWYADDDGEFQKLDEVGWARTRHDLLESLWPIIRLYDAPDGLGYRVEYYGKGRDAHPLRDKRNATCALSLWLPTEFLEAKGPARIRELALKLATPLAVCSGYAGLSFNGELDIVGVEEEVIPLCLNHPGIGLPNIEALGWELGARFRGPSWLTFIGPPLLRELGGVAALRSRLHSAATQVQALEDGKAVISLGEWPEAGDTAHGDNLPAYRELARVLEPWLFHNPRGSMPCFREEAMLRWERRFLD